jgi:hypothetical protein
VSRVIFRAYAKICYLVCNRRSLAERGGIENTDL